MGIQGRVIFVTNQAAAAYYQLFDLFVLTSDMEGMSLALLEAMSHALPCVVTNKGSSHAIITDMCDGILAAAGNKNDIAAKLLYCLHNKDKMRAIGHAAQKTVNASFSIDAMAAAYKKMVQALVQN